MPRYSPSDRVIVRPDLNSNTRYSMDMQHPMSGYYAIDEMLRLAGAEVTIEYAYDLAYKIEEEGFYWTDEMFSGFADEVSDQPDFEPGDMSIEELLRS